MSTFDSRENAFEAKFAHDADELFRLHARRDKLLGHWAADKLGLTGQAATDYTTALIEADVAAAGDATVVKQLIADLAPYGVTADEVHAAVTHCLAEAAQQLGAI